jgi:hypothetical protein
VAIKNLVIAEADLLAGTSDPDGDTVAFDSVTSTNATATRNSGLITISASTQLDTDEYIEYKVNDNVLPRSYRVGDTVRTAANYIHIVRTNSVGAVTIEHLGGSTVNLSFYGIPGYNYVVQRGSNVYFTNYAAELVTNTAPANGLIQYLDVSPPDPSYYRMRSE